MQSGQDQGLLRRFKAANLRSGDPIQFEARPSYIYRWYTAHSNHLSALGDDGYERLAALNCKRASPISPGWDRNWSELCQTAESEHRIGE
jgi:hypothetical protein